MRTISEARPGSHPLRSAPIPASTHRLGILRRIDRLWAAAILFTNGWLFTLPIAEGLPVWFTPVQVVHGVFTHETLLFGYLFFGAISRVGYQARAPRRARLFGYMIAALGGLALVSAFVNMRPLKEFMGAARYLLLAAYFFVAVYWTKRYGRTFVLRYLLLGMIGSGAVNLYYTFKIQSSILGGLPLLLGEQGPGGYFGMAVILSAWLMFERQTRWDTTIALASGALSFFAVSISYSKLAMLMAAAGVMSWCFVLWRDMNRARLRKWYAVTLLVVAGMIWMNREVATRYVQGAGRFIEIKFKYVDQDSVDARLQYFPVTAEILERHPLFGVGYGGFYDAAMATEASKNSRSARENPDAGARGESNPHSSFLYYASANGVPGLFVILTLLALSLLVFAGAMSHRGLPGKALWASFAFGYLIFGLTLPTLFNSSVLYLPVAVAVCLRQRRVHYRRWVHLVP